MVFDPVPSTLMFLLLAGSTMWSVAATHSWLALRFQGATMVLYYFLALTGISCLSGTAAELIAAHFSQ